MTMIAPKTFLSMLLLGGVAGCFCQKLDVAIFAVTALKASFCSMVR